MTDVEFANVPGHVCGWESDFDSLLLAVFVDRIDVFDPDRHPDCFFERLVAIGAEGLFVGAFAPSALAVLAEEDFAVPGADSAERWRSAPVPAFLPT